MNQGRKERKHGNWPRGCSFTTSSHLPTRYLFGFILGFTLLGCQQIKPNLTYQPLLDQPVQSRAQPASLSQKSTESLIQEGFVKIGYIDLRMMTKSCRRYLLGGKDIREVCETNPELDPLPWLLQKGADEGGDLIVIEFEKSYTENMDLLGLDAFYAKEFSRITAAVWRKNDERSKELLFFMKIHKIQSTSNLMGLFKS